MILYNILLLVFSSYLTQCHIDIPYKHNFTHFIPYEREAFTPAPHTYKFHSKCQEFEGECVLPVQCPAHVNLPNMKICNVIGGRQGYCCKTGQNHTDLQEILKQRIHNFVKISKKTLTEVTQDGHEEISKWRERENELLALKKPPIRSAGSASYGHFRNRRVLGRSHISDVSDLASKALEIALATRAFKERHGISNKQLEFNMISPDFTDSPFNVGCPMPLICPLRPQIYRSIDGSCNNPFHPRWGAQLSPYSRLLPPSYSDGVWAPRLSKIGLPLPSPRSISTSIFLDLDSPSEEYTLMLSHFGQFVAHDITFSIDTTFPNGTSVSCCTEDGTQILPSEHLHYSCMPIEVHEYDPFFSRYNVRCMNFARSVLAPRQDCSLGYAEQMNKVTHYIDASTMYGSTEREIAQLRSFQGGRLRVFNDFGRELLPLAKDPTSCVNMEKGSACFDSGDTRTNLMIGLVAVHTLFMREHNRVAGKLESLNPHWNDEKLFLEARRIVIAEIQVIIYKEFLPVLLGETAMEEFSLKLAPKYFFSRDYNPSIEPSIINEFAAAAFRFGHSMVDGLLKIYGKNKMEEIINIPEIMFQPSRLRKREFYDELLSTLTTEPIQRVDNFISDALTRYLFRAGNPFGIDLAAMNIQRGRDHGLRPYNDYRELIGLPRIKNFEEFGMVIGFRLSQIYTSVDDVDLWVGGLLENKEHGSVLGPTFRDIVAEQFSRLKKGDRYFFENGPSINPSAFTSDQLEELKSITMSRIICDNSDGILLVKQAPNAFRKPGVLGNEYIHCDSPIIPSIDLTFWEE